MKVELHLHTSRYSGCATATPVELMRRLIETGYEAVYITEHDAVWSAREIARLQAEFPAIRIFPGVELSLGEAVMPLQHLLVLGTTDRTYLKIHDPAELLEMARSAGHLTVLAHPCRWEGGAAMLDEGLLPDAIELHTCNHDRYAASQARILSEKLGLRLVNSGDTHGLGFLNRFWIETARPIGQAEEVRSIILEGAYDNRSRDDP